MTKAPAAIFVFSDLSLQETAKLEDELQPREIPLCSRDTNNAHLLPHCFRSAPLSYKKVGAETQAGSKEGNENYMGCGFEKGKEEKKKTQGKNYLTWKGKECGRR